MTEVNTIGLKVHYAPVDVPEICDIYQNLMLSVEITNSGSVIWDPEGEYPVNIGYHWFDAQGNVVEYENPRIRLPKAVAPNETITVELKINPPAQVGKYLLEIDLVQEMVAWFGNLQNQTLKIPIDYVQHRHTAPKVCIVAHSCMANDAVGNHVAMQIEYFERMGYNVLALLEFDDPRRPIHIRRSVIQMLLHEFVQGDLPHAKRARAFFDQADIVIFHYPVYFPLMDLITMVEHGIVIFDYHGVTPPHLWEGESTELLVLSQQKLSLAIYADYAITHSNFTRDELLASKAINIEQITVMPYIVSLDPINPNIPDPKIIEKYNLQDQHCLLYVGRMAANKRIIDLIRAMPYVLQEHPNTTLLLVGDDKTPPFDLLVQQAKDEAAALGCADKVIFTGPMNHSILRYFFNACDVYVTSSLHEGFCIPVVEAMACGKPVVGTYAAALPETIGDAGLTFQAKDSADLAKQVNTILATQLRSN